MTNLTEQPAAAGPVRAISIKCAACGNTHSFIVVETRSVLGEFHPDDDGTLIFSPRHETADLQHDHIKCGKCSARVTVEEFEWAD